MTPGRLRGLLLACSLAATLPCRADVAPSCHGRDLMAAMTTAAPDTFTRLDQAARGMAFGEGHLFRIARPGVPASFLFGTVHLADPRVAELPPGVHDAIVRSRSVAVETLEGAGSVAAAQTRRAIAAPDGLRAGRLLSAPDLRRLEQLLVLRGFAPALARDLKPLALALMLDIPVCASAQGHPDAFLDAQVMKAARTAGIPMVGLETLAEQVDVADDLAADEQAALLRSVLVQAEHAEDVVETTVTAYAQGRIGVLLAWTMTTDPVPGVRGAGTPKPVLDRIITARTRRMRDRLLPMLDQGALFIAIGATHIPGPDGLGVLLQDAGYSVERLQ